MFINQICFIFLIIPQTLLCFVQQSPGVDRCSPWHRNKWSHLGAEDPDGHLPQGRGIRSWLHLKQQVLLLPGSELGSAETERNPAQPSLMCLLESKSVKTQDCAPASETHQDLHVVQFGDSCQKFLVGEVSAVSHEPDVLRQLLRQMVQQPLTWELLAHPGSSEAAE